MGYRCTRRGVCFAREASPDIFREKWPRPLDRNATSCYTVGIISAGVFLLYHERGGAHFMTETPTAPLARVHRFVELSLRKRDLQAQLREIEADLQALMEPVKDEMAAAGLKNMSLENGVTVYLRREIWAKAKDGNRRAVVDALQSVGLDDMVSFNTQSLTAYVRRADEANDELPSALREVIELTEEYKACVKQS
jgi:hypothetical protein